MSKFKAGDRVKVETTKNIDTKSGISVDDTGVIVSLESGDFDNEDTANVKMDKPKKDDVDTVNWNSGNVFTLYESQIIHTNKRTSKPKPTKFILQYELDEDPFETFTTKKALVARIKELLERSDLKRESMVVYNVSKVSPVTASWKVDF